MRVHVLLSFFYFGLLERPFKTTFIFLGVS